MVSFFGLIAHNVRARWVRSLLTALAVAIGVATVATLGVVTHSLRSTAAAVLRTGKADFTVAQGGVADVLNSVIDENQLARLSRYPGVRSVVGALITTTKLNADNPLFIEIGIQPDKLAPFGVRVVDGRAFAPRAPDEVLLGWRAADDLGKHTGDTLAVDGKNYRIVGIFSTGQALGDAGVMLPLVTLQANQRQAGQVTLAFVQVDRGTPLQPLRQTIHRQQPTLTTVRLASEFGRVDRNFQLITAIDHGATYLALVIGAVIVTNTMLLSFFERTREFGLLRAVGWKKRRVMMLVIGEALIISLFGAALGVALAFGVTTVLEHLPQLTGYLHPEYQAATFWRALYVAVGIGFLGALYPALRAALLQPLRALRYE
jgi:putative ABC transport system permease protein